MDALAWLAKWYAEQCDGDWEHSYGLKIDTLDNPGWILTIDLSDTSLSEKRMEAEINGTASEDGTPDAHWYYCKVENSQFIASCGVYDLPTVVEVFRRFSEM